MPDESTTSTTTIATTAKTEPAVDKDALEIGELIKAAGFQKGDVNVLTESAASLASIRNLIESNPVSFLDSLEKANPDAAHKFEDALAENYLKKYGSKDDDKDGKGDKPLATELKLLRQKISDSEAREVARDQSAAIAQVKSRYDARVDDLLNQLPKELALTKTEKEAFRAKLNTDMAADPSAIERAAKGNFIDVPNKFLNIVNSWTEDKKAAAEAEKTQRENASKRSMMDFPNGPNPFMPSDAEMAKLQEGDDWEVNIEAFGKALEKAT